MEPPLEEAFSQMRTGRRGGLPLVSNVSDTARWVASYRAAESERPDALFHDPYAGQLAGNDGLAMTALAPRHLRSGWPLVVRTKLIDDIVATAVSQGCDCIVNLGAGFDTRPYRLRLPPSLSWVEADMPAIIDEKEALLRDATPSCSLERVRLDLANQAAREALLKDVSTSNNDVLVISEGVLVYLDDHAITALSDGLIAHSSLRWWLVDFFSPRVLALMQKGTGQAFERAPLKFAPPNGVAFFEKLGWSVTQLHSVMREATRLRRAPLLVRLAQLRPEPDPRQLGTAHWGAVVLLEHAARGAAATRGMLTP